MTSHSVNVAKTPSHPPKSSLAMQPNILTTNKRVTKMTDKARAALEDKLISVASKHGKDDQTHKSSTGDSINIINGHPDKAPAQETSTNGTARKVEVEEVNADKENNSAQRAGQLPDNSNAILIGHDEQGRAEIETIVDSEEELTPKDELSEHQMTSEEFVHISIQKK